MNKAPSITLPRLSSLRDLEELPVLGEVESPGAHCGLFEAALTGPLFTDACTLLIGPGACLYHARMTLLPRTRGPAGLKDNLALLSMDQADTVFGVEDRVVEAIREADRRFQPKLIFLVSTCVPEMIGTDLDAVIRMAQGEVQAQLLPVRTDGFSGKHQQLGNRRLLASLAQAMEPLPVRPRAVNILGMRGSNGRASELVRVLEGWGVEVLCAIPAESTFDELRQAPAASLNLVVTEVGLDLAREMEQRFGTPFLFIGQPLHPDQVQGVYLAIATALGVTPGDELGQLAEQARRTMTRVRRRAAGLRAAVALFMGGALGATRFLSDLGLHPEVVFLNRLTTRDQVEQERLLAGGIDPLVARTRSTQDTAEVLRVLKPQIFAGHGDPSSMARLGIAHLHPDPPQAMWGFSATQWAAEMVEHAACELTPAGKE